MRQFLIEVSSVGIVLLYCAAFMFVLAWIFLFPAIGFLWLLGFIR